MRRRPTAIVAGLCVLVFVTVFAIPVLAHANTLEADSQVSPDGTVQAESVFVFEDAWLVVHRDDSGEIGEAIGHRRVPPNNLETEVPVEINRSVWADWNGSRPVHLALHHDDGDGTFTPTDDPILSTIETTAATRIVVERGSERAAVHAARIEAQQTNGSLTVRQAVLPADGFLVLHPPADADRVVGTASLSAGGHQSTSFGIDEAWYRQQEQRFELSITLYRDDGNGEFGSTDTPIQAGEEAVSTTVTLERTDERTPMATTEDTDGHDHEHTEETEDDHHDDSSHDHEDDTTTGSPTPTDAPTTDLTGADGAGPGPVLVLVAIAVGAIVMASRGRRS